MGTYKFNPGEFGGEALPLPCLPYSPKDTLSNTGAIHSCRRCVRSFLKLIHCNPNACFLLPIPVQSSYSVPLPALWIHSTHSPMLCCEQTEIRDKRADGFHLGLLWD